MTHAASPRPLRIAVVTACWQEPPEVLAKCMASVKAQTHAVTHILVSDGVPFVVPDTEGVIRVQLPFNIGNYGSTPRGFGGQLAFNMGFDAVAFLDADNWYEPDHIEQVAKALQHSDADVVFAKRRVIFPDGEVMSKLCPEDELGQHVDTNCYVFRHTASYLLKGLLMWPAVFGAGDDRMLFHIVRNAGLRLIRMSKPTVWYVTNWPIHYKVQGKAPVAPLRQPARTFYQYFDDATYFQLSGIKAKLPRPAPLADAFPPSKRVGLVVVDGRAREAEQRLLPKVTDIDLYVVPNDVPHPCHVGQREDVFGMSLPRHQGDHGTAAGLAAALLFLKGCERVVVFQGDWRAAHDELPKIVARVLDTHQAFHVETVALQTGEIGAVTVFTREHAHLCLLYAQLPMDLDASSRLKWLHCFAKWHVQHDGASAELRLPQALTPERAHQLRHRLGLRLRPNAIKGDVPQAV